jgi:hypothetical protein
MSIKRVGYITSVTIEGGGVICTVEDKNTPTKEYSQVIYGRDSANKFDVPPLGTEVLVENIQGEYIVTKTLSSPASSGVSKQSAKDSFLNEAGSMSFVFQRESASEPESVEIEYSSSGYEVSIDVDGDIKLSAGGTVLIEEEGTKKKVATVDHDHEFTYTGGGEKSSSLTGTTETATENTNN